MKILLVYPEFLVTFWNLRYLLKILSRKAAFPPLGLLTVAAMLPKSWSLTLVDLNIQKLTDEDIKWADYVFISAMTTQIDSAREVIRRCNKIGVPVVLGGPILEIGCDRFCGVKHFLLREVENTMPEFLADLQTGKAKRVYSPENFPELASSPVPLWSLVNPKKYVSAMVQYNRGCPYGCKFCSVARLNGRKPRTKSPKQFLRELDAIYKAGFRGAIFVADDNFIGDKKKVKEMLPWLIKWQQDLRYPFSLTTEVDITLAEDSDLMEKMVLAGFKQVFLGLETPNKASLIECGKLQNTNRDMAACVKMIQNHGLVPMSGFIVGFDSDKPYNFDAQMINFIQETGIVVAMVGVLQAPPGTLLHIELQQEGRLRAMASGNNADYPNFVPKMPLETLMQGYKRIIKTVYSPRKYYERISVFLREYNTEKKVERKLTAKEFDAFISSLWRIGLFGGPKTSYYYWKTLLLALFKYRKAFPEAVALQIYGRHFQKIAKNIQRS